MKRFLVVLLAAMLLTGCGNKENDKNNSTTNESKIENQDSEKTEENKEEDNKVELSSAIDASKTKDTEAIPLGKWAKTTKNATKDKTYHTVYVRLNKITTQSANENYIKEAIDVHNKNAYDYEQIDISKLELPSDVELCILDYEVYVPEDFPSEDYGITEPKINFQQQNIGGGGIPSADNTSSYIGLGTNTEELKLEKDPVYKAGNTYSFRNVFPMVKGYENYVFDFTTYQEGTKELSSEKMYHAYFANK